MLSYVGISVLLASLAACFGQAPDDSLREAFQGSSSECQEALVTCALPLVLPYATATDPIEVLERASNIRLGEHCRKTKKSFNCFGALLGNDPCSEVDPRMVRIWKLATEPLFNDIWTYICRTEFKKFSIHYRCLLTSEVFIETHQTCHSVKSPSEATDCVGQVIKEQCGSTASQLTTTLLETVIRRAEEIQQELHGAEIAEIAENDENGDDDDDDDEEEGVQSTLPENVYATQLNILKKLLKRK